MAGSSGFVVGIPSDRGDNLYEVDVMAEVRRKYDPEFREGAVRIVRETNKPIVQVAKDLGIHAGTLGNWVKKDRIERGESEGMPNPVQLQSRACRWCRPRGGVEFFV